MKQEGIGFVSTSEVCASLEKMLRHGSDAALLARVDWNRQLAPAFSHLGSGPSRVPPSAFAESLAAKSDAERDALVRLVVRGLVAEILGRRIDDISDEQPLMELGLDSMMAIQLRDRLSAHMGVRLSATVVFDHPAVRALAVHLLAQLGLREGKRHIANARPSASPIAITGLALRFPGGAHDERSYWDLLERGASGICEVPKDRWDIDAYYDPDPQKPGKMSTRFGGFLAGSDVAAFDAPFFGIAPVEARSMDPQQRLALECVHEALENAGYASEELRGSRTGVYVGISTSDYAHLLARLDIEQMDNYRGTGVAFSVAAGRISYAFGFEGPAVAMDTACSSSLYALHSAVAALRNGDCELAVVVGVNLMLMPELTVYFSKGGFMSHDGQCKTFDASADGYVRGEGVGAVILKAQSDAERDGDRIRAILRSTAINQDGRSAGLTVPNGPAQEAVIREALARAALTAADIDYVEAHGTGTQLGDPIEVQALAHVYGASRSPSRPLLVGSVKTNIGHLEAAAGMASLIKVILALEHEALPGQRNVRTLSQNIPWADISLSVLTKTIPWKRTQRARRAAISGFAFQGSNAHVIVEEARLEAPDTLAVSSAPALLVLSAKTEAALRRNVENWVAFLRSTGHCLSAIAYTALHHRSHFRCRIAVVASDVREAEAQLASYLRGERSDGFFDGTGEGPIPMERDSLRSLAEAYVRGARIEDAPLLAAPRQRVDIPTYAFERHRYWLREHQRTVDPAELWAGLEQVLPPEPSSASTVAAARALERAASAYALEALVRLGEDAPWTIVELIERAKVAPQYRQLLERWCTTLADQGWLQRTGETFQPTQLENLARERRSSLEAARQAAPAPAELCAICGEHLFEVLTGRLEPRELLFSQGSQLVERIYRETQSTAYCNDVQQAMVRALVAHAPPDRRIRVLEVGAGTGATTALLLSELPAERTSYVFTDVGPLFLRAAKARFAPRYPFVTYKLLDLDRAPSEQGFAGQHYDAIVAVNVLHATKSVEATLHRLCSLLADGGYLLLTEVSRFSLLFDITFGLVLQPFEIDRYRTDSFTFLSAERWRSALLAEGFERVMTVPQHDELGQHAIVAQKRRSSERGERQVFGASSGKTEKVAAIHPLLGLKSELADGGVTYTAEPDAPYLSGRAVPGRVDPAVYLETLQAAGRDALHAQHVDITNVALDAELVVDDSLALQVLLRPRERGMSAQIYSRRKSGEWCRHVTAEIAAIEPPGADPIGDMLYETRWIPTPLLPATVAPRSWMIIGTSGAVHIAEALQLRDHRCRVRAHAPTTKLDTVDAVIWVCERREPPVDVEELAAECKTDVDCMLSLARYCTQVNAPFVLVTEQAQEENVVHAPLIGILRALDTEQPVLRPRSIDVDSISTDLESLVEELIGGDDETEVRLRAGQRWVSRFQRKGLEQLRSQPTAKPALQRRDPIRDGASYLVVGATRGIGVLTVERLSALGARKIVVMGRRGPEERAKGRLERVRESGATVVEVLGDVSRTEDVDRALAAAASLGPLRGVIHAAGALCDGAIEEQQWSTFEPVYRPKVFGLFLLARKCASPELDFFVCFSSVASDLGFPGRAHVAAANAFENALCRSLHRQGVRALSVGWGPWAEIDPVADDMNGLPALGTEGGSQAIERLLCALDGSVPAIVACRISWEHFTLRSERRRRTFFGDVIARAAKQLPSLRALLARTSEGESAAAIERVVEECVREVLELEPAVPLDRSCPLIDLGLDSMMAVLLRNQLQAMVGQTLVSTLIFDHPSVVAIAAYLRTLLDENASQSESPAPIVMARAPLSFSQLRLWFLEQLEPGTHVYSLPFLTRMRGPVDADVLTRALVEIVRRHEVLRTAFRVHEGEPYQLVLEPPSPESLVQRFDISAIPADERASFVEHHVMRDLVVPFDLSVGAPLRIHLFLAAQGEQFLYANMHHAAGDGFSFSVVFRELGALYDAFARGLPSPLPPLPMQYKEYAIAEQAWFRGETKEALERYWLSRLAPPLPTLELDADRPRPELQTYRGGRANVTLPASLYAQLVAAGRSHNATPFMVLLACYAVLLQRHGGGDDVIVGTPTANRRELEHEQLFGFFVNTLALRLDLSDAPAFVVLIDRVRDSVVGALTHQDMPFDKLVEVVAPVRDRSRSALFQAMFSFENFPESKLTLSGGVHLEWERPFVGQTAFDLTLCLAEDEPGGVTGYLEYNADIFDQGTVERMAQHFVTVAESVAHAPEQPIRTLWARDVAREYERLNATERPLSRDVLLTRLIADRAQESGDALALAGATRVTYGELDAHSQAFSRMLLASGVCGGDVIAIAAERSAHVITAMLGALRAEIAYLPIDPAQPPERAGAMLESATLLVCSRNTPPVWSDAKRALHHEDVERFRAASTVDSAETVLADVTAYVMHTSGTTGRPKGVRIGQCALLNHALACVELFALTPVDRVLSFAAPSFDVAAEEIFPTLIAGACVVLHPPMLFPSFAEFARFLEREGVTVVNLPSQYWHEWVTHIETGEALPPDTLRLAITGSDAVAGRTWAAWRKHLPHIRLLAGYGTTETTISSAFYEGDAPRAISIDGKRDRPVPVGRPIANTRLWIVDGKGELLPSGMVGELCISGLGLASGYVDSALDDRFGALSCVGARVYHTGDRARLTADGDVEVLGRMDEQLKIRGYRVEPAEVERGLASLDDVAEAAVVVRPDASGTKRLLGYVVTRTGSADVDELKRELRLRLPEYMVPIAITILDHLPMTSSGKIDRRALPEPLASEPIAAPNDETEIRVANVFCRVLGVHEISTTTNFFDAGGHSLLIVRLAELLASEFNRTFSLVELFERPTVASLAAHLRGADADDGSVQRARERAQKQRAARRRGRS